MSLSEIKEQVLDKYELPIGRTFVNFLGFHNNENRSAVQKIVDKTSMEALSEDWLAIRTDAEKAYKAVAKGLQK